MWLGVYVWLDGALLLSLFSLYHTMLHYLFSITKSNTHRHIISV